MSFPRLLLLDSLPFRSHKLPPFSSLLFRRYSSSGPVDTLTAGGVTDTDADTSNTPLHHPWPEWVSFVDKLKTKGYFNVENIAYDALVKVAAFNFARDRYDIFRSLSTEDIRTVVGHGCSHVFHKVVICAKRLRAHVGLDELDVCSGCNLRGSCNRADVILEEDEAAASLLDMVRVLLYYARDPLVVTGGEKPPGREIVHASVRKLFSQLIELSETAVDLSVPKPASKSPLKKAIKVKEGDWMCPKCNFMNFSRNSNCLQCGTEGPKRVDMGEKEIKKGDWNCPQCNFMNYSRNMQCLKCRAEGPKRVDMKDTQRWKGDWTCPRCGFMNFAKNKKCLRCADSQPMR